MWMEIITFHISETCFFPIIYYLYFFMFLMFAAFFGLGVKIGLEFYDILVHR